MRVADDDRLCWDDSAPTCLAVLPSTAKSCMPAASPYCVGGIPEESLRSLHLQLSVVLPA